VRRPAAEPATPFPIVTVSASRNTGMLGKESRWRGSSREKMGRFIG